MTSLLGNIKGGNLRAVITTTPQRISDLPDVPTAKELGSPEMETIVSWSALYGPENLPQPVIDKWVDLLSKASKDEGWLAATRKAGNIPPRAGTGRGL